MSLLGEAVNKLRQSTFHLIFCLINSIRALLACTSNHEPGHEHDVLPLDLSFCVARTFESILAFL